MDMIEALEAVLAFDEKRQRTGKEPRTKAEKWASDIIGMLSPIMQGAFPEIAAAANKEGE